MKSYRFVSWTFKWGFVQGFFWISCQWLVLLITVLLRSFSCQQLIQKKSHSNLHPKLQLNRKIRLEFQPISRILNSCKWQNAISDKKNIEGTPILKQWLKDYRSIKSSKKIGQKFIKKSVKKKLSEKFIKKNCQKIRQNNSSNKFVKKTFVKKIRLKFIKSICQKNSSKISSRTPK